MLLGPVAQREGEVAAAAPAGVGHWRGGSQEGNAQGQVTGLPLLLGRPCPGRLLAGHCVHSNARDVRLLAGTWHPRVDATSLQLLPGLRGGPIPEFLAGGVQVGMGTDDGCCNDTVNLLADMKVLACLHRATTEDPSILTAEQIIEMATMAGPVPRACPIALAHWSRAS